MIGNLSSDEIEDLLQTNILGRLACNNGNRNYIVPISYVYDGKFIIAHSMEGLKIDMMRSNPDVCFEVDEINHFQSWKSVIIRGQFQELKDERERLYAMKLFLDKMIQLKISQTAHPNEQHSLKPVVFRIIPSEKTGRFENE
jgi:nitroimidazol reductase NimA-like FMN-containing flavoprotein (pyridoxamine 5'-phosphate oxidase superfamily)